MTTSPAGIIPEWTIADRLRKARELTGLERIEFADELNINRNTVTNYESGKTKRHQSIVLRAWAMRTGVPLRWLETGESGIGPDGSGQPISSG